MVNTLYGKRYRVIKHDSRMSVRVLRRFDFKCAVATCFDGFGIKKNAPLLSRGTFYVFISRAPLSIFPLTFLKETALFAMFFFFFFSHKIIFWLRPAMDTGRGDKVLRTRVRPSPFSFLSPVLH